jgi:transaldolase / glucose-6-phosphate isomerase
MSEIYNGEIAAQLGQYETAVTDALQSLQEKNIIGRIWDHDHTVWADSPDEISNRLGWLQSPQEMAGQIDTLTSFAAGLKEEGYSDVLLLGMGGSSLAPELFANVFGPDSDGLNLAVLDSTDPGAVLVQEQRLDLRRTLFIVATKSGGTAETLSFFKYFYNRALAELGAEEAGRHFVAITDPGSKLEKTADRLNFRRTFLNNPNIGGRYSVLSYFGLVPAALIGLDLAELLQRAQQAAANCGPDNDPVTGSNQGAFLGTIMGILAQQGVDKLTLVTSPNLSSFGDWVEQLVAESTGKAGQGILPVVGEPLTGTALYGQDRLFVYLQLGNDISHLAATDQLAALGHPVLTIALDDLYDLGGQFFVWEMATAVASHHLQINPFDQPNVESAKIQARRMMAAYEETGQLPESESAPVTAEALADFVAQAQPGDYIALQAFVQPTAETDEQLHRLRIGLCETSQLATTLGYGPRFLHSTGQLHKGDGGNGLFIQFTSDAVQDVGIPDEAGGLDKSREEESAVSFNTLKLAQALGDAQALRDENRRLIRFHLGTDVNGGLATLLGD